MVDNPEEKEQEGPSYVFAQGDITRFIKEKWRLVKCEVCETENSYQPVNMEKRVIALPVSPGDALTTFTLSAIVAFPVICTSCGNTKLLSAPVIKNWLEKNP